MKAVHSKVNIVPIIAKADTLTKSELTVLKQRVSWFSMCGCCFELLKRVWQSYWVEWVSCSLRGPRVFCDLWFCGLMVFGLWLYGLLFCGLWFVACGL